MNFMEAVKAMKEGKNVKREGCHQIHKLVYDNVVWISDVFPEDKNRHNMTLNDIEANDWQIIEEKKTLSDKKTNASQEPGWQYQEEDVKEALKEFREWILENMKYICDPDNKPVMTAKAKEIFGKRFL